jgi:hypothetical protein
MELMSSGASAAINLVLRNDGAFQIRRYDFGESVVWLPGHVCPPAILVFKVEDPGIVGMRCKILNDSEASRRLSVTDMWFLFNQASGRCDDDVGF